MRREGAITSVNSVLMSCPYTLQHYREFDGKNLLVMFLRTIPTGTALSY